MNQREIKFRAWDTEIMVGGFSIEDAIWNHKSMRQLPLMQYTGLKDCHGKEVYEGDIIKSPLGNIVKVFFGQKIYQTKEDQFECNGWVVKNLKNGLTETLDFSFLNGEVIGNIYEHPHLLENGILSPPKTQADAQHPTP